MKKFLLLLLPAVVFCTVLCMAQASLFELSPKKEWEAAYSTSNLGFVLEERRASNFINYVSNGTVVGECVFLDDPSMLSEVCDELGLLVLSSYTIGNKTLIEGVAPRLKYKLDGSQANVQICMTEDELIIGSPIIYGSY